MPRPGSPIDAARRICGHRHTMTTGSRHSQHACTAVTVGRLGTRYGTRGGTREVTRGWYAVKLPLAGTRHALDVTVRVGVVHKCQRPHRPCSSPGIARQHGTGPARPGPARHGTACEVEFEGAHPSAPTLRAVQGSTSTKLAHVRENARAFACAAARSGRGGSGYHRHTARPSRAVWPFRCSGRRT